MGRTGTPYLLNFTCQQEEVHGVRKRDHTFCRTKWDRDLSIHHSFMQSFMHAVRNICASSSTCASTGGRLRSLVGTCHCPQLRMSVCRDYALMSAARRGQMH